jgi:hypothetical protein
VNLKKISRGGQSARLPLFFPKVTLPVRVPSPLSAENVTFRDLLHRLRPENPLDNPFTASDHSCSPQRSKRVAKTL